MELKKYYLDGVRTPSMYNDIVHIEGQPVPEDGDVFKVNRTNGGPVPDR